jgi:hypothetical protein
LVPNKRIEIKATGSNHLSLQGMGGAGRSIVAHIPAQHLDRKAQAVRCIHPDPANKSRSEYKGLRTAPLKLFREKLRAASKRLFGRAVITGAQAFADTLIDSGQPVESTSDQNIVVWVSEYFSRVDRDGKQLLDINVFEDNAKRVRGTVAIAKRNRDTFGRELWFIFLARSIRGVWGPRTKGLCGAMVGLERPKIRTTNVRFSTGTKGGEHQ